MSLLLFTSLLGANLGCIDNSLTNLNKPPDPGAQPEALAPDVLEEVFTQRTALASDILFVVDDSGSMEEEQQNLADNFRYFAQYLFGTELDFHIGVVRNGMTGNVNNDGALQGSPRYIDPSTPDGEQALVQRVTALGTGGASDCESGLGATFAALTDPMLSNTNAGFYREDANLTVVLVSDENDNGTLGACGYSMANPEAWAEWIGALKPDPRMLTVGMIAGFSTEDNRTAASCSSSGLGSADAGTLYALAAERMGGITWSICNADWSGVMAEAGLAAAGLSLQFNLGRVPGLDTEDFDGDGDTEEPALIVAIDRQDDEGWVVVEPLYAERPDAENAWDYDPVDNAIVFTTETMPRPGWQIRAQYPNEEER